MKRFLVIVFLVSHMPAFAAQQEGGGFELGYFAPYFSNYGFSTAYMFGLRKQEIQPEQQIDKQRFVYFSVGLSYFVQRHVYRQALLLPEIVFARIRPTRKLSLMPSLGAGYLLSFQKQEGSLNLASGEIEYRNELTQAFLPQIAIKLSYRWRPGLGFYLKPFYGRNFRFQGPHAGFFGLSAGLSIYFLNDKAL